MSFTFSIPGGLGLTTVEAYTTGTVGTTRVLGDITATTITTNTTNVAPHGFASTANMAAHTASHAGIVADLTQIKKVLNSIVNDLKAWGLSS